MRKRWQWSRDVADRAQKQPLLIILALIAKP
jgi:hypothetical protein